MLVRRPGALWAVGRQVNPQHRESEEPRSDDYVWEGYELDDCLEAANGSLAVPIGLALGVVFADDDLLTR